MVVPIAAAGARAAAGAVAKKGVQNASRSRRTVNTRSGSLRRAQNPNAHRQSIPNSTERFIQDKDLSSRSKKPRTANDNEEQHMRTVESTTRENPFQVLHRTKGISNQTRAGLGQGITKRMSWWLIGAASAASFWIFIFGLIGLTATGLGSTPLLFGITADSVVSFFGNVISFVSGQNLGNATLTGFGQLLSFVGTLIAFCSYLAIGLWYQLSAGKYPNTTMGMLVTAFCVSADMLLGLQLFPWLVVWVFLVEIGYLSSDTS